MTNYADWFTPLPLLPLEKFRPEFRYPILPRNDTGFGDRVRKQTEFVPTPVPTVTRQRRTPEELYFEKYDAWAFVQAHTRR